MRLRVTASVCVCFVASAAGLFDCHPRSQLAAQVPGVGYTYPPGAPAGSTVEIQLGGYDFTPDVDVVLHQSRATLKVTGPLGSALIAPPPYWFGPKGRSTAFKIPREFSATITLPANLPRGPIHWQVTSANGVSGTAVFFVGDGFEVLESRRRSESQALPKLPVTVNGRLSRISEVDLYTVTAGADGCLSVELFARRLGADFNGHLRIRDVAGELLADVIDTAGVDCAATVSVRKGQRYTIEVADLDHRGHRSFVYRLEVNPGPRVVACLPSGGRPGTTVPVTFVGYGLKTGAARLESTVASVTFPKDSSGRGWYQHRLETRFGPTSPVAMRLTDLSETVESATATAPATGSSRPVQSLAPGSALTGRLGMGNELDEYELRATGGQRIRIEATSVQVGTRLDPVLSILDSNNKPLASNDDFGGTLDSRLDFQVPAEGSFRVRVHNGIGEAGRLDSVYRLTARLQQPGFTISVPQSLPLAVGGKATLTVSCERSGGFVEEIEVEVSGLPEGVSVPKPITIPKAKNSVKVIFEAAKTLGTEFAFVTVTGTATIDTKPIRVMARTRFGGNLAPRSASARFDNRMLLVPTLASPVTLELVDRDRQRAVHRGTTYPAEFVVKRDMGFTGPIRMRMAGGQQRRVQGMSGPVLELAEGAQRVEYPCFMPEWLETDRTTRMLVQSVAIVKDATGRERHVVKATTGRITMILEGALMKLAHQAGELTVVPGASFEVPVKVVRSAKMSETAVVGLELPKSLVGLIRSEPLTLKPGQSAGTLKLTTRPDRRLEGDWTIRLVATALHDDRWPAVSVTDLTIRFQATDQ